MNGSLLRGRLLVGYPIGVTKISIKTGYSRILSDELYKLIQDFPVSAHERVNDTGLDIGIVGRRSSPQL
ncbi:MAG: hypothetical protein ACI84R_001798 [Candidatus Azotimanducaceae bacterium]|jgi:hypothetical protein